jgi:DNA polymerase I-like protein with 3'-5' exonuclease and polymerase domains
VSDFYWRRIRTIQVGDKQEQFIIDLLPFAGSENALIESQGNYGANNKNIYRPILDILAPVLCTNNFLKVGQHLPFEYEVLHWNLGLRIWNLYSIDLAERVIKAGAMSLKNYPYFSLEQQVGRYFGWQIDKSNQTTFDLKSPLNQSQLEYGALDIRMPLAVRQLQLRILERDKLSATVQIENDALGSYTDMHLYGQAIDKERWRARVQRTEEKRVEDLKELDTYFIPIVGNKNTAIDEKELNRLEEIWKTKFEFAAPEELSKAAQARQEKDAARKLALQTECKELKKQRADLKAAARCNYMVLSKLRTKAKALLAKCKGEALINYNSGQQLLAALKQMKGLSQLKGISDDDLIVYNDRPMIQTLRRFKKGMKGTGTYGLQWTQAWVTKPCTEEGWLHPGDGRLHCVFNQLEAETGRSSSAKPNAQNLPGEDDVRACFICDPPNENVRISVCCDSGTSLCPGPYVDNAYVCDKCNLPCETKPEEMCIVTVDMAGAELRIIADLANATSWINAFNKKQDVHSVGTELLYPTQWPALQCVGGEKWFDKEKNKEVILPPCAYFIKATERTAFPNGTTIEVGDFMRLKCKCPEHQTLRNGNKSTNFLLCYGGGPPALADALGISLEAAKKLYKLHEFTFPDIWGYLKASGEAARDRREARDMFGRRRLFPEPTWDAARAWFIEERAEKLELDEDACDNNIRLFKEKELREPTEEEKWALTHHAPTTAQISSAFKGMFASIERRGKNMPIQGTNASIIKRSLGCGFDKDGQPYLWHTLLKFKAHIQNMVHDELVVQCPRRYGEAVAHLIGDAFKRAAAEVMTRVTMEYDYHISNRWLK